MSAEGFPTPPQQPFHPPGSTEYMRNIDFISGAPIAAQPPVVTGNEGLAPEGATEGSIDDGFLSEGVTTFSEPEVPTAERLLPAHTISEDSETSVNLPVPVRSEAIVPILSDTHQPKDPDNTGPARPLFNVRPLGNQEATSEHDEPTIPGGFAAEGTPGTDYEDTAEVIDEGDIDHDPTGPIEDAEIVDDDEASDAHPFDPEENANLAPSEIDSKYRAMSADEVSARASGGDLRAADESYRRLPQKDLLDRVNARDDRAKAELYRRFDKVPYEFDLPIFKYRLIGRTALARAVRVISNRIDRQIRDTFLHDDMSGSAALYKHAKREGDVGAQEFYRDQQDKRLEKLFGSAFNSQSFRAGRLHRLAKSTGTLKVPPEYYREKARDRIYADMDRAPLPPYLRVKRADGTKTYPTAVEREKLRSRIPAPVPLDSYYRGARTWSEDQEKEQREETESALKSIRTFLGTNPDVPRKREIVGDHAKEEEKNKRDPIDDLISFMRFQEKKAKVYPTQAERRAAALDELIDNPAFREMIGVGISRKFTSMERRIIRSHLENVPIYSNGEPL